MLDESKIQDLIKNEIKLQVQNKLKQIGRDTIKDMYRDVMAQQIREFLNQQEFNLSKEIKEEIMFEKESWKKIVTDNVSYQLADTLVNALRDSDRFY